MCTVCYILYTLKLPLRVAFKYYLVFLAFKLCVFPVVCHPVIVKFSPWISQFYQRYYTYGEAIKSLVL